MRKRIVALHGAEARGEDRRWLDLEHLATVEVMSEHRVLSAGMPKAVRAIRFPRCRVPSLDALCSVLCIRRRL